MMRFFSFPSSVLFLLFFSQSNLAFAKHAIHFSYLKEVIQDRQLALNAVVDFELPDPVISAIHHDIPIRFKTEIVLLEEKPFWGMTIERVRQSIEYHTEVYAYGMNRYYVLYNHRNHKRQAFQTLEGALQTLGTLQALPVMNLSERHPEKNYVLRVRISLDKWKLPPPLLIDSLLEAHWQLDSGWQEINIQIPKSGR